MLAPRLDEALVGNGGSDHERDVHAERGAKQRVGTDYVPHSTGVGNVYADDAVRDHGELSPSLL